MGVINEHIIMILPVPSDSQSSDNVATGISQEGWANECWDDAMEQVAR